MPAFGIVGLTVGLIYGMPFLLSMMLSIVLLLPLTMVAMGIANVLLAARLNRRQWWAVAASLVLVSFEILCVSSGVLALVLSIGVIDIARGKNLFGTAALAI